MKNLWKYTLFLAVGLAIAGCRDKKEDDDVVGVQDMCLETKTSTIGSSGNNTSITTRTIKCSSCKESYKAVGSIIDQVTCSKIQG